LRKLCQSDTALADPFLKEIRVKFAFTIPREVWLLFHPAECSTLFQGGLLMSAVPRLCERCGSEIPAERVEALPDTEVCIKCSTAIGGEYHLQVVEGSLAKAGSLKRNYGTFSVHKTRKKIRKLNPPPTVL
jgi:hypothetical protein